MFKSRKIFHKFSGAVRGSERNVIILLSFCLVPSNFIFNINKLLINFHVSQFPRRNIFHSHLLSNKLSGVENCSGKKREINCERNRNFCCLVFIMRKLKKFSLLFIEVFTKEILNCVFN